MKGPAMQLRAARAARAVVEGLGRPAALRTPVVGGLRWQTTLTDASLRRARTRARKPRPDFANGPSFEGLMLRAQVLQTYRDVLRTVARIQDPALRAETHAFAKGEFRACADVSDIDTRRSLLVGGLRQIKSVTNNLGLSQLG